MMFSRMDIAPPSPHNIYYVDWCGSGDSRRMLSVSRPVCRVLLKRSRPLLARAYRSLLAAFVSPDQRTCNPSQGLNVSRLLTGCWSEQVLNAGVGILPRTDCTFISRVHDPPGSAGFNRYFKETGTKKRPVGITLRGCIRSQTYPVE